MAKLPRYYWDACAWLGLVNRELAKNRELQIIWKAAEMGKCKILTSALSQVEVFKKRCEKLDPKPLSEENDQIIAAMFAQDHVARVQLDPIVAENARKLLRTHTQLKKAPDAVHLATALYWNCDAMHTYDNDDLLRLSGQILKRDGTPLVICIPDHTSDGPLFGGKKDVTNHDPV